MTTDTLKYYESEQLYMRYGPMPYYTSFDMVSLILSSFKFKIIINDTVIKLIEEQNFTKYGLTLGQNNLLCIIKKYIDIESIKQLFSIYSISISETSTKINDGNFASIITPIITTTKTNRDKIRFTQQFNDKEYIKINKLHITNNYKQIVITIPFYKTIGQKVDNMCPYDIDSGATDELYNLINIVNKNYTLKSKLYGKKFNIVLSMDRCIRSSEIVTGIFAENNMIIKTSPFNYQIGVGVGSEFLTNGLGIYSREYITCSEEYGWKSKSFSRNDITEDMMTNINKCYKQCVKHIGDKKIDKDSKVILIQNEISKLFIKYTNLKGYLNDINNSYNFFNSIENYTNVVDKNIKKLKEIAEFDKNELQQKYIIEQDDEYIEKVKKNDNDFVDLKKEMEEFLCEQKEQKRKSKQKKDEGEDDWLMVDEIEA